MDETLKKVLFIGAKTFSGTGGIEQVNKSWIYSLAQQQGVELKSLVLADDLPDETYTHWTFFTGYRGRKLPFLLDQIRYALNADLVVISHVQLAILVPLLKFIKPKLKTLIICHGIEVWRHLNILQLNALKKTDQILAVSTHTKKQLVNLHQLPEYKITVFPNALDPFFAVPENFEKAVPLMKRYQIRPQEKVLLTIARLSSAERYKGYDYVIESVKSLKAEFPHIKYIIGGKADENERKRLENLIQQNALQEQVILPGFIAAHEMVAHYQLADVFVMPSTGEGFGISFIESAACGTPVLGGNTDGSSEAIVEGITGKLCTPRNPDEISGILEEMLRAPKNPFSIQENALKNYSFAVYHKRIANLLASIF